MTAAALPDLVAPLSPAAFLAQVWGRAPRRFAGTMADHTSSLLDLRGLEHLLATLPAAHDGWLHTANGTRSPIPTSMLDDEQMVDLGQLRAAFAAGASLYLTKVERLCDAVMDLTRAVEVDLTRLGVLLRRSVNAHVFLTPPAAQAFGPHRDEHASLVIQLEGDKDWTVFASAAPGRVGAADPDELVGADRATFALEAGDVLYIPEWWPHEARTGASHSLHVTLRVFPLRWSDVLAEIAARHPALEAAVTAGEGETAGDRLGALLLSDTFREPLADLVDAAIDRHMTPRVVLADDGLRQVLLADSLAPDSVLVRARGMTCRVTSSRGQAVLAFPGGTIRAGIEFAPVLEAAATAERLRPCDLPAIASGDYDRVDIARRFVARGLFRVDAAPAGAG